MTEQTPPDWVLIEAAKRGKYPHEALGLSYRADPTYAALCDMIAKHEQPPVDRKVLCAREGAAVYEKLLADGMGDYCAAVEGATRAIELWEQGYGQ